MLTALLVVGVIAGVGLFSGFLGLKALKVIFAPGKVFCGMDQQKFACGCAAFVVVGIYLPTIIPAVLCIICAGLTVWLNLMYFFSQVRKLRELEAE